VPHAHLAGAAGGRLSVVLLFNLSGAMLLLQAIESTKPGKQLEGRCIDAPMSWVCQRPVDATCAARAQLSKLPLTHLHPALPKIRCASHQALLCLWDACHSWQ
jgi:hypothetical protein